MNDKLNILIFKFALVLGGGERFSFLIAKKFQESGESVKFYSNYPPLLKKIKKEKIFAKKIYWGKEIGAKRYLLEYFLLLPINIIRFGFIFLFNRKRGHQNIVVFQNLNEKIFATSLARFLGYKVFWVEHLSPYPWLVKNYFKNSYLKKSKKANKIIAISESLKGELIGLGIKSEKIEVVYNGVDGRDFYVYSQLQIENEKKKYGFFKNSKIIGYVGRLHKEKGLDILIAVFHQLLKRFDHLYLLLVGDGPEREKLEELVRRLSLEKRVIFLGQKENIPLFLNMIDVFVLPSNVRESFGIVLIEAMACGKVVVGSDLGGIPEIIKNESNGFLFTSGDERELADKLSRILSDEKLREKIIANALKDIKNKFSLEIMIKKLEGIFRK